VPGGGASAGQQHVNEFRLLGGRTKGRITQCGLEPSTKEQSMSRILPVLSLVSALSGAAYADDTTTPKEVAKAEVKDDKTAVALAGLDEALKRNAKPAFESNANEAIDALQARKGLIHDKMEADAVDPEIQKAKAKVADIAKMPDTGAWKNVGMELQVQLNAIDKRLDKAELNPGPPAATGYQK
jgi:hypothetical protein